MPVADTSFLVAFFDEDDPRYRRTRTRFAEADHVVITTETLVETLGVLKSRIGRRPAEAAVGILMKIENVGWEETCDLMAAYRIYQRKKTSSLMDAMVIHLCVKLDTSVLTYDTRQEEILQQIRG